MTITELELKQLIRGTDPAPIGEALPPLRRPLDALVDDLVTGTTAAQPPAKGRRIARLWLPIMAAAAVVTAGTAVLVTAGTDDHDGSRGGPRPHSVLQLSLPGSDGTSIGSCMPFSVEVLGDMPVAFSATATDVHGEAITLQVDHWYRGGDADEVQLAAPDPNKISTGGIEFSTGTRYLITATNGTVNYCGYSARWSPALERDFEQAFTR